jgi:hypothetical protein
MSTFSSPVMRAAWYGSSGQMTPEQAGASLQAQSAAVVGAPAAATPAAESAARRSTMGGSGTALAGNPTGTVLG